MSWIDNHRKATDEIEKVNRSLRELARSFGRTHNAGMAAELYRLSDRLRKAVESADNVISDKVQRDYSLAQQSSANVLKACLAGTELSRREAK